MRLLESWVSGTELSTVSQQQAVFSTFSPLCAVIAINSLSNVFGDIMLLQ